MASALPRPPSHSQPPPASPPTRFDQIECFNAILGLMQIDRVMAVAETLLRLSPDAAGVRHLIIE